MTLMLHLVFSSWPETRKIDLFSTMLLKIRSCVLLFPFRLYRQIYRMYHTISQLTKLDMHQVVVVVSCVSLLCSD